MKTILIIYKDEMVDAYIVGDYKATISQKDAGCLGKLAEPHLRIELDQCKDCGTWCSEDDEMYGDGYCTKCADMCSECQEYKSNHNMTIIDGERICFDCIEAFKNSCPNSYKYHQAIDECPYAEAIDGDVKVQFEYIGEGLEGDYTGEEDDVPFMRFYIFEKSYCDDGGGTDHPDWNWVEVDSGSYCTRVPIDTPKEILEKMVKYILNNVKDIIASNRSIRHKASELSWICEDMIK